MVASKKAAGKQAAPTKAAAPKKAPAGTLTRTAKAQPAAATAPDANAPAKKKAAPKRDPSLGPVIKTRVVIPMAYYEGYKDDIKAPIKALGLKWNFLGEGKGLYKRDREVHCFTQFMDDGVHYSVWGDDKKAVDELLGAWRKLAGEVTWAEWLAAGVGANVAEQGAKESEATKLWKLQEPQRRPGEPDLFYNKRRDEWMAKKPA